MMTRAKKALGIDVCRGRVSLALVGRRADGFELVRGASVSLPQGAADDGVLGDVEALAKALRKLRRHCGIRRMKATVGISLSPLVMRILDLPEQMPANVAAYVTKELRQCVALSGRDIISDFCRAGGAGGPLKRLITVGTDREKVRTVVNVCSAAGLIVEAVEPGILAWARAIGNDTTDPASGETRLIVEVNGDYLAACLLQNGLLESVRARRIPPEAGAPATTRRWLADEIKMMVRYYHLETSHGAAGWKAHVIVRGGTPIAHDAAEFLRVEAGIDGPVVVETGGSGVGTEEHPTYTLEEGASSVALGLALKQLDRDHDTWKVNLLPREVTQQRSFVRDTVRTGGVAALLLLGMVLSGRFITRTAGHMHQDIERTKVREQLDTTAELVEKEEVLDREVAKVEHRIRQMTKALDGHSLVAWPSVLTAVRDTMPADVGITRLSSSDPQRLSLTGVALSYGAAQAFARGLERLECLESASLTRLQRHEGNASLVYDIECLLKTTE